jgi:cytochrome c oxidase subunit 1
MLYTLLASLFNGKKAPPNPWGSAALEWTTPTPPPVFNFIKDPVVTRGPYDYHLATDAELFDGFPEDLKKGTKDEKAETKGAKAAKPDAKDEKSRDEKKD